jgi:hypothetical protein
VNPGFWHSNFYPTNFWHENFWQDFGGLTTNAVHIFSTGDLEPNHITDSGNNVLLAGDIEIQGDIYTNDIFIPDQKALWLGTAQTDAAISYHDSVNTLFVSSLGGIAIETISELLIKTVADVLIEADNTKIGGAANYLNVDANGIQTFSGSSAIHGLKTNTAADKTGDYQVLITDDNISIDATSNTVTITLEASPLSGRVIKIACSDDTFTADIDFNGNTLYGGSDNEVIYEQEILVFQFNGTEWRLG